MSQNQLIAIQYKNILKLFIFFLICVALYLAIIISFPENIFIGRFAMYLVFVHYFALLGLIVTFLISIGWRLFKLLRVLKEARLIKMPIGLIFSGYVLTFPIMPLWLVYLEIFWVLSNRYLRLKASN